LVFLKDPGLPTGVGVVSYLGYNLLYKGEL